MGLIEDFERILGEVERLDQITIPAQSKRRIANCYARAVEKCLCLTLEDQTDPAHVDHRLFRHAERGLQDPTDGRPWYAGSLGEVP